MKKNIKTLALLLAAALTAVLLSGCVARDMRVSFGDDGKISCIVSDLIAQSYFEAAGTDAQTYYKDEIEAGRELISKKVGNETYYGLKPERYEFDTIEEFFLATESGVIDAFSATAQNDGGYISATVTVDMPAKGKVKEAAEGYGAAAALADKAVKILNVHFPQKVNSYAGSYAVTISEDQKDLEAVLYYFDEAYSFRVTGYLSEKYVVNASLKMGRPEEGRTPGGLMENARLESYPRGSADLAGAEWRWYDMSTPVKTEIGADEPFVPGRTYAVECTLRPSAGFMACEYTDCYVWDQNSRGAYIGGLEPDMIFITGQYTVPGEEPAVYQPAPVIVPDDTAYVVPGSQDNVYDTTVTLDKIELEIDEPRVGVTYPDLKWRFRDPEGIDAGKVRFRWMEKASGTPAAAWEEISENYEFGAGSAFGFDMYVALEKGYAVTEETEMFVNGEMALLSEFNGSDEFVLSFDFPALKEPIAQLPSSRHIPFVDIRENDYFRDAVIWAFTHEPQITDGTSATTFSPDRTCTRGQVVTFLWREAGCPEPGSKDNPFADVKESDYFYKPVLWAVEKGITDGTSPTTFSPANTCKNSHILTFIYRAVGEPRKSGEGAWWQDALDWADRSSLLSGSYTGTYDVNADCLRANVVYYLYMMNY